MLYDDFTASVVFSFFSSMFQIVLLISLSARLNVLNAQVGVETRLLFQQTIH